MSALAGKYLESAQPDVVVHCDASGSIGCAAWWFEGWLHYEWPPEVAAASITPSETLPVVSACAVWDQLWRNKQIWVYCDNEAAVANLNSGRSKDPVPIFYQGNLWFGAGGSPQDEHFSRCSVP